MFETFPRVRHELESVGKKYKQFFTATAVEIKADHKGDTLVHLALLKLVDSDRFIRNADAYITMLEKMKLISNPDRQFKVIPRLSGIEIKKKEIVFNGDTINPMTLSITWDVKNLNTTVPERGWVVMYQKGTANARHTMDVETLIKFLDLLQAE